MGLKGNTGFVLRIHPSLYGSLHSRGVPGPYSYYLSVWDGCQVSDNKH